MNTQLVFYVSYGNTALALVVDKHRQSATVFRARFRTCQNEVDV